MRPSSHNPPTRLLIAGTLALSLGAAAITLSAGGISTIFSTQGPPMTAVMAILTQSRSRMRSAAWFGRGPQLRPRLCWAARLRRGRPQPRCPTPLAPAPCWPSPACSSRCAPPPPPHSCTPLARSTRRTTDRARQIARGGECPGFMPRALPRPDAEGSQSSNMTRMVSPASAPSPSGSSARPLAAAIAASALLTWGPLRSAR